MFLIKNTDVFLLKKILILIIRFSLNLQFHSKHLQNVKDKYPCSAQMTLMFKADQRPKGCWITSVFSKSLTSLSTLEPVFDRHPSPTDSSQQILGREARLRGTNGRGRFLRVLWGVRSLQGTLALPIAAAKGEEIMSRQTDPAASPLNEPAVYLRQ